MIDIEALGTAPRGVLLSFGALKFNIETRSINLDDGIHVNIFPHTAAEIGMEISGQTVMWWLKQSEEARAALFDPRPQHIKTALRTLKNWFPDGAEVWAHDFDFQILSSAFTMAGIKKPWHYRDQRDLRTLYKLAGGRPDMRSFGGTVHNPTQDAYRQVLEVLECFTKLSERAILDLGGSRHQGGKDDRGKEQSDDNKESQES
jgi:hypothetical protein